jgi:hypothetical protein
MKRIIKLTEGDLVRLVKGVINEDELKSTRTEFTEKEIEGIGLVVKLLSNKYKFIKGWEFHKDYKKFVSIILINIIIDLKDVAKQYDIQISDFWFKERFEGSTFAPYTVDENRNKKLGEISERINKTLNIAYPQLSEEYIKYHTYSYYGQPKEFICKIVVNYYQTEPTSNTYYEV